METKSTTQKKKNREHDSYASKGVKKRAFLVSFFVACLVGTENVPGFPLSMLRS
jgi:hypothetical protein